MPSGPRTRVGALALRALVDRRAPPFLLRLAATGGFGGALGANSDSRAISGSTFCGYIVGENGSGAAVQKGICGYGMYGGVWNAALALLPLLLPLLDAAGGNSEYADGGNTRNSASSGIAARVR